MKTLSQVSQEEPSLFKPLPVIKFFRTFTRSLAF